MQHSLSLQVPPLSQPINYGQRLLLIGSCFTEHISERLERHKFSVVANPHGILFNPLSVASSLHSYMDGKQYQQGDLFTLHELWNSWDHHTRFSHTQANEALAGINASQATAAACIHQADWVIITLGSAFQYYLRDGDRPVANNHRAPAQWFHKQLLGIDVITAALQSVLTRLAAIRPTAQVLFTISPVRHIRDGVVENNRSKARLIEAVHTLCGNNAQARYFPAYELIIDILRDYRYYDIDCVHPNFLATSFVWDHFVQACIAPDAHGIMQQVNEIATARNHRPRFPATKAHQAFRESYAKKIQDLADKYAFLNLGEELHFFTE